MAVIVVMVMAVMMVVIVVMVVTVAGVEEFRLDLQDTIQIERAAFQHVREGDLAALGAVQFCVRIDASDAGLDFG
jgi:hypothetical protein